MAKKRRIPVQFRYYDMPSGQHVFALLGESWRRNYGGDISELHFHNYLEIGICREGAGTLIVEERCLPYQPGMISVLPQNTLHTTNSGEGGICFWEYLFVDVEGFFREYYREDVRKAEWTAAGVNAQAGFFRKEEIFHIYRLTEAIMEEEREQKPGYREIVNGILGALLLMLARGNGRADKTDTGNRGKLRQVMKAVRYLELHYQNDLAVENIAGACHMSESHFRRLFGECMHMTPLEYLNFVRVEKACEQILKTGYSMEMIAEMVGFQSQASFIRNFKEYLGITPYQWKKQAEKEDKMKEFKISAYKGW